MLAAVEFDNQVALKTNKIDDVFADWMLPTKFERADLTTIDLLPESFLRISQVFAQCSCIADAHALLPPILPFPLKGGRNLLTNATGASLAKWQKNPSFFPN